MLNELDSYQKGDVEDYEDQMDAHSLHLGILHRQSKEMGIPVMIVFEGWDVSGKSSSINRLLMAMDPRNYHVHPIRAPTRGESLRPYLWRFWIRTPSNGKMSVFDRSWYTGVIEERVNGNISKSHLNTYLEQINSFERQLSDDSTLIIKFFLHLSEEEQEKRLKKLEKEPMSPYRYLPDHWERHKHYSEYRILYERILEKTSTPWAPWKPLPAIDHRKTNLEIFRTVTTSLEVRRNQELSSLAEDSVQSIEPVKLKGKVPDRISSLDLSKKIGKDEYHIELDRLQNRLMELQTEVYRRKIPVMIVYSGVDSAGKGGNIRRLVQRLDPRGYKVIPISVPTDEELSHHYLWRFWKELSQAGRINIFDRSWYGRVLVERVEGLCSENEWKRAYREINEMEEQWVDFGAVVSKFWLQIDKEEQLRRFGERLNNPYKNWKITHDDWRNRGKWDHYIECANEMIFRTDTKKAPWTIVEANSKKFGRIKTLRTIVDALERRLEVTDGT
jgi:polyphosphate:AMP phosphotransferase